MKDATGRSPSGFAVRASVSRLGWGLLGLLPAGCLDLDPEPVPITYGTITDARDGRVYRTLTVEGMTWMQQDLNFQAPGSICPDSTCALHFYSWSTAMGVDSQFDTTLLGTGNGIRQGVCPAGWHLPTLAEWLELQRIMRLPGIAGDWASNDGTGFGLKGWNHSGNESLGSYWIADETGSGTVGFARFQVSYPMYGPQGLLWIEQVTPVSKKAEFGIRCLSEESK